MFTLEKGRFKKHVDQQSIFVAGLKLLILMMGLEKRTNYVTNHRSFLIQTSSKDRFRVLDFTQS